MFVSKMIAQHAKTQSAAVQEWPRFFFFVVLLFHEHHKKPSERKKKRTPQKKKESSCFFVFKKKIHAQILVLFFEKKNCVKFILVVFVCLFWFHQPKIHNKLWLTYIRVLTNKRPQNMFFFFKGWKCFLAMWLRKTCHRWSLCLMPRATSASWKHVGVWRTQAQQSKFMFQANGNQSWNNCSVWLKNLRLLFRRRFLWLQWLWNDDERAPRVPDADV